MQSHYPQPPPASASLPTVASDSSSAPNTYNPHLGHPGSTFQGGLPLYQPGGNVGQWAPSPPPPNTNSSGLAMPMYWPGYYAPPHALSQSHQQSLPRPPQGLGIPPSLQQQPMQYPSFNSSLSSGPPPNTSTPNLPEYSSASSASLTSNSLLGSTLPSLPTVMHNKPPISAVPTPPSGNLQSQSSLTTDVNVLSGARFPYQGTILPISSSVGGPPLVPTEPPMPSLVTPGQLMQSVPAGVVSSQTPQVVQSDVEVAKASPTSSSPPSVPVAVPTEAQPPILPLPTQTNITQKVWTPYF